MSFGIDLFSRQVRVSTLRRLVIHDRGWTTEADHIKRPALDWLQLCIKWIEIVSTRHCYARLGHDAIGETCRR